jgi:hypothetical protein
MNRSLTLTCAALALALLAAPTAAAPKAAKPAPAATPADTAARTVLVASTPREDSLLAAALERMVGVVPGSDTLVAWDLFRAHPQRTVDLIIPTLRPVKRDLYLGAPNLVWRVRVLQRLTGLEFRAPTHAKLSADERAYLAPDSARVVRFAGENRDRGMTWTAPADAQKAILAKWRAWWDMDAKKPELPMVKHAADQKWWY